MISKNHIKIILALLALQILFFSGMECHGEENVGAITVSGNEVNDEEIEEEILPTELDMGDYQSQMIIGEKQLLMITALPEDSTDKKLTYTSLNAEVATINGMGRITALKKGETIITVTCGNVQNSFRLNVVEDTSQIAVRDIEISDYEKELKVDSTLRLLATVLPADATDTAISYQSSDNKIATVNSSGEVKGIAPGQVIIYISAGGVKKQISLTVKVGTMAIELNSDYQILKPGETFQIKPIVKPEGATRGITYKSLDTEVATVSESGVITAKECGDTVIIVSNGDLQVSVSVLVNNEGSLEEEVPLHDGMSNNEEFIFPDMINAKQYPIISSKMLKYFYEKEKLLTIKGEQYTIFVDGKDIVNFENELDTRILFKQVEEGIIFVINNGQKLCGKIVVDISDKVETEKYLYLFNEAKQKYEKLTVDDIGLLTIDTEGTYMLTSKKLSGFTWNTLLLTIGIIVIVIGVGVYIGIKKQYWFW